MAGWLSRFQPQLKFAPGEFEVLTTKAQRDWWQAGTLVMTNYRICWFISSANSQSEPVLSIDMQNVLGCVEVRSWYYLLTKPALRVLLVSGKSIVFHDVKDFGGVKANIERFMGNERYTPGSLFTKS